MTCYVQTMLMFVFAAVMAANEPSNDFEKNRNLEKTCSAFFVQIRRLLNPPVYNPPVSVTLNCGICLIFTYLPDMNVFG